MGFLCDKDNKFIAWVSFNFPFWDWSIMYLTKSWSLGFFVSLLYISIKLSNVSFSDSNKYCIRFVYSFALKPEQHQPSGTCNFSRIETAKMEFKNAIASKLSYFAVNYNILRITSGMGSLSFGN